MWKERVDSTEKSLENRKKAEQEPLASRYISPSCPYRAFINPSENLV